MKLRPRGIQPRLPYAPLAEFFQTFQRRTAQDSTQTTMAQTLGISRRNVHRWATTGGVPAYTIDRALGALGIHPSEVWGKDWQLLCDALPYAVTEAPEPMVRALRAASFDPRH